MLWHEQARSGPPRHARHPHLRHRRSPDSRASDGGSGGMALEIHAGNEGVKPGEAV